MSLLPHKKHHDDAEFDITAMIDLVFLMNIYFMFLFINKSGGELPDMPMAAHAAPLELEETMTIVVMAGADPNYVGVKLEGEEGEFTDPGVQEEKINRAADAAQAAKKTKLLIKAQKAVKLREIQRIVAIAIRDEMTLHVAVMETGTGKEEHH